MTTKVKKLARPFELKTVADNGTFTGYGSVFGERDSYRDVVIKGAFSDSLDQDFAAKKRKVPMLWQHDYRQPIGVYTVVKEDSHGLYVEGEINMDVQKGVEAHALMKQGALTGLSIGYETIGEEWDKEELVRKLTKVKLYEISPVTFPAGDSARVSAVKSIAGFMSLSDCEDFLREAGLSQKEACALIARIKAVGTPSDSAGHDAAKIKRALDILTS